VLKKKSKMIADYICLQAIERIEWEYISAQGLIFYLVLVKTSNINLKIIKL